MVFGFWFNCMGVGFGFEYMATSLMRNHRLVGPYRRPMARVLGGS